jgi:hypothetical protein
MAWSTEKDMRLFILNQLNNSSKEFRELYRLLKAEMDSSPKPVLVKSEDLAA